MISLNLFTKLQQGNADGSAAAAGAGEVAEDITYLHVQLSVMAKSQSESLPLQQDAMPWI
jgi:hypothetical protein